ncbi:MAG: acetate--CoA ligase family protein, partial [Myxococcota bacterium]
MRPWTVLCDDAELAVEIARGAAALGLPVDPRPSANLVAELARAEGAVALAYVLPPGDEELVALAAAARAERPPLALLVAEAGTLALARELGFPAVLEVEPFLALMALGEPPEGGFAVPLRPLSPADRRRLTAAGARGEARPGEARLEPGDGSRLQRVGSGATQPVGSARDVAEALVALRDRERAPRPALPRVEGVDRGATRDVLLGPRRALSDPTSKAALAPYDVPFPAEELCASASRAAAEATRLGFPVRVALASPALRGWDHPELVEARVESAARVRDVYRQLHALAAARAPDAPLLGVTVSA